MILKELFDFQTGKLPALEHTENGNIPLVYGTSKNNGIVKFVDIKDESEIFKPPLITVSYLGTAFVHLIPFTTSVVDKSNIIILKQKTKMTIEELYFYAIQINRHGKFGFHYGRRMNMRRLSKLSLVPFPTNQSKINIEKLLPNPIKKDHINYNQIFMNFKIDDFFKIYRGQGNYLKDLDEGNTPVISATNYNNGIVKYANNKPIFKAPVITVERIKGTSYVQLSDFITVPDDIYVLKPINTNLDIEFLFYISSIININRWKFCYGRKVTKNRLLEIDLSLPVLDNMDLNIEFIKKLVRSIYGWETILNY